MFQRVWVHIIFTNNISNQGFLSKNSHIFSGTKNVVLFKKISFHTDGWFCWSMKLKLKWFLWGFYDSCPSGSVFGLPDHFLVPNHGYRPLKSAGELLLVSSDRKLSFDEITAIYQKRWKVEDFYKSVKSNASFAKSPARTVRTQSNHCFAAIYAFVKLEKLRIRTTLNHFAIKGQIYIEALKIAYDKLEKMSGTQNRLALV